MANVSLPTNAVDLDGLSDLRRRAGRDDPTALAEVAVQFEALVIGMMLDSARSASVGSGLFDGSQTQQYLELMDHQVALEMARRGGFGFAKMLTERLAPRATGAAIQSAAAPERSSAAPTPRVDAAAPADELPALERNATAEFPQRLPPSLATLGAAAPPESPPAPTPAEFVAALLPEANAAAAKLGVEPKLLLAQAALETGWGRAVPQRGEQESANNLFGIKAGSQWPGARVEQWTLEHVAGVDSRQLEPFRAYGSTAESFADYVDLIATARRYAGALAKARDPEAYAHAVTAAGYATDPKYAQKWLAIYHGDRLESALQGVDLPVTGD